MWILCYYTSYTVKQIKETRKIGQIVQEFFFFFRYYDE